MPDQATGGCRPNGRIGEDGSVATRAEAPGTDRPELLDSAMAAIREYISKTDGRVVVGIAGPPAAGKSTLATALGTALRRELGADAAVSVPMDGFHLSNVELRRLGLSHRKGAPATFDVHGFVHLLRRI